VEILYDLYITEFTYKNKNFYIMPVNVNRRCSLSKEITTIDPSNDDAINKCRPSGSRVAATADTT
jgi:hypothetical protein